MRRVSTAGLDRQLELWARLGLHVETPCRYAIMDRLGGRLQGRLVERFRWPVVEGL